MKSLKGTLLHALVLGIEAQERREERYLDTANRRIANAVGPKALARARSEKFKMLSGKRTRAVNTAEHLLLNLVDRYGGHHSWSDNAVEREADARLKAGLLLRWLLNK